MSEAAIKELIARQVDPLWKALGDAMKERTEMKLRIDELESSETNLKNLVENVTLNNERLIDEVEKMRIENAGLGRPSNENEISGGIQQLTYGIIYSLLIKMIFLRIESEQAPHCNICFNPFNYTDHIQCILKCGHKFGAPCIMMRLTRIKSCPTCNQPVSEGDFQRIIDNCIIDIG